MATLDRDALDPEIRAAVQDIPNFVFSAETVPTMRQTAVFSPAPAPDIQHIELSAGLGGGVDMTVLRPHDVVGDLPVLYWMHGGGTVIGNRFMDSDRLNDWCRSLSCVCVSVEYRLAPEARYPAAIDDCDQGLRYLVDHAADLRVDPRHSSRWVPRIACATRRSTSPRDCARPESRPSFMSMPARCTASTCSPTVRSSGAQPTTAPIGSPANSADAAAE